MNEPWYPNGGSARALYVLRDRGYTALAGDLEKDLREIFALHERTRRRSAARKRALKEANHGLLRLKQENLRLRCDVDFLKGQLVKQEAYVASLPDFPEASAQVYNEGEDHR